MICSRPGIGSPALHLKSYFKDSQVPTLQSHSHPKRQQMCASTQHPQGVPSLGNSTSDRRCYCCWLKPTSPFVLAPFPDQPTRALVPLLRGATFPGNQSRSPPIVPWANSRELGFIPSCVWSIQWPAGKPRDSGQA